MDEWTTFLPFAIITPDLCDASERHFNIQILTCTACTDCTLHSHMENEYNSFCKLHTTRVYNWQKPLQQSQVCIFGMDFHAKFIKVVIDPNIAYKVVSERSACSSNKLLVISTISNGATMGLRVNLRFRVVWNFQPVESLIKNFITSFWDNLQSCIRGLLRCLRECSFWKFAIPFSTSPPNGNYAELVAQQSYQLCVCLCSVCAFHSSHISQSKSKYRFAEKCRFCKCHTARLCTCCVINGMEKLTSFRYAPIELAMAMLCYQIHKLIFVDLRNFSIAMSSYNPLRHTHILIDWQC